ncbi:MAG TPA: hypothetical protein VFX92_00670 [Candidatus Krumholzibacteria bacterium]|nr:hypothetical protein [Candidatus Krumholzibacteria bacterium]
MKSVAEVIQEHAAELLAIEGVAGVYEGKLADGRDCMHVAVVARSAELEARIPRQVEGHPVVIVETGPIGPL